MSRSRELSAPTPAEALERLVQEALHLTKAARRQRKNLSGDNFYGNKLAALRADATNSFRALSAASAGDATATAELINAVFAAATDAKQRLEAARELSFSLKTTWKPKPSAPQGGASSTELFPLSIVVATKRGYLVTIARQMNGCYEAGWHDACAVMMRRLLEVCIIEAFEAKAAQQKIRDVNGDYFQLSALIDTLMVEPSIALSRNAKRSIPKLRDVGHQSAHGRYFSARQSDIELVQPGCRIAVEELLNHAGLL